MKKESPSVLVTVTMTFPEWVAMKDYLESVDMFSEQVKKINHRLVDTLFVKKEDLNYAK